MTSTQNKILNLDDIDDSIKIVLNGKTYTGKLPTVKESQNLKDIKTEEEGLNFIISLFPDLTKKVIGNTSITKVRALVEHFSNLISENPIEAGKDL